MEGLGRIFQKNDESGDIYGLCLYGAYFPISHQKFVDNVILFGLPTWIEVKRMGRILHFFMQASVTVVNTNKSKEKYLQLPANGSSG